MSRGTNQKFKFTYLMKIMLAKTDDEFVTFQIIFYNSLEDAVFKALGIE